VKFLKNLALGLLSFLLFFSLAIFGFLFMVNSTILNPDFVVSELDRLDVSSLVGEFFTIEAPPEVPYLDEAIDETIAGIKPLVKEQVSVAIYSIYDYLLGETQNPDLAPILRNTFLSTNFVSSLVDEIDISSLAGAFLSQQLAEAIPLEIANLDKYITDAITEAEPSLKEQIVAAADPVFDYLLMESQTLNVAISLEPVKENLRDKLLQAFLESPPSELAAIPPALRESYFNQFYQEFSKEIPSTFQLDESVIGTDAPANIARALTEAEEALELARQYIGYFQLGYILLIVFMSLLVLGIILISRQVKDITRRLGIPLLIYGATEYAGIFVAKYFIRRQLHLPDIPPYLETWTFQFIDNLLNPLEMFSLGLLISGAVLIIVSFVYKRGQSSSEG